MSRYYITTPIYYVNDKPHIGHTYTTMVADTLARFHRVIGDETFFLSGTDENSQKNVQAMEKAGKTDLAAYLEEMAGTWKTTWDQVGISLDDFIRTTEERHLKGVERFWNAVKANGDIYEGEYVGRYCSGCEAFKNESEIMNGVCALHPNKPLDELKEKNYFFRASKYRDALLEYIDSHESLIQPVERKNEIRNYIKDHFVDFSISREAKAVGVGIPVPGDATQVVYVWFDALINYLTAIGYGTNDVQFKQWWPASLHLVGKDIIKFHCAIWPAMLMSASVHDELLRGEDGKALLPARVHAHGFFTIDGQKVSKSLGNAVDPLEFKESYGLDAVRYYLLREISFGSDGDFSRARLHERYTSELGNTLGNLVQRTIAMSIKYCEGIPTSCEWEGASGLAACRDAVTEALHANRADIALESIWQGLMQANKLIEDTQPFKLVKEDPDQVKKIMYWLLESLRWYAVLLGPLLPTTSKRMFEALGLDADEESRKIWKETLVWGVLKPGVLPAPSPLFPRIEVSS